MNAPEMLALPDTQALPDSRFTVSSENFESIHNHSAYAEIQGYGAG